MYDFRTLSPLDFEDLTRDLLQAELELRLESFGPGPDQGIDCRFAIAKGVGIVQAKHYPDADTSQLIRLAKVENAKVQKLKPARYIFSTSATLTPHAKTGIKAAMPDAPLADSDILGRDDLNNLLNRHPKIEQQHFKLWLASTAVLERILHSGVYNRTQAEMDEIKAMVPKFVQNQSVPTAEAILQKHGALIIAGEPGIGKSTLARILVWLHAEKDWRISVIDDIREAFEIADGNEKHLVFFDDFLGQVGLTKDLIRGVDQRFPPFFRRVRSNPNLRFILTTRDYILRQAQAQSSRLSASEINAAEFVLNVSHYTRDARAKILYNHIYFSALSASEREQLIADDFFLKIIDHRNFNPRLVDLLTSADYVSIAGRPIRETVLTVLDNPQELWEKPYRNHISDEGRAVMLALFFNDFRVSLINLEKSFGRMVSALDLPISSADLPPKFRAAVKELEGSVAAIQDRTVSFSNPGVRDFLQRAIREDRQIEAVVGVVVDFEEVTKAWQFWSAAKPATRSGATVWLSTARRLVHEGHGTPLDKLSLTIDMLNEFGVDAGFEDLVKIAIDSLDSSGTSTLEVGQIDRALESIAFAQIPPDVRSRSRRAVVQAAAKLLKEDGPSLEEIETVTKSLIQFGDDPELTTQAAGIALQNHIDELASELAGFSTVEEVEEYETELERLVSELGVDVRYGYSSQRRFEERKGELGLRPDPEDEGYTGRRRYGFQATHSDAEIRSMFSGLKSSN